ncbi:hypothetical protein Cni_G22290 [Canna indica]|uniref:G-patch domain-containing protein n=1 Tax=Canna indica TaxID=4628 RepID=A0AAQ3KSE7_9LILI|nr:hypothetical protein Cni_G22290 [Canna indica]
MGGGRRRSGKNGGVVPPQRGGIAGRGTALSGGRAGIAGRGTALSAGRAGIAGIGTALSAGRAGIAERPRGGASAGGRGKMDRDRRMPTRGNLFGYTYPSTDLSSVCDDFSGRIVLSSSESSAPIEAFVDSRPCPNPEIGIPLYEYDPAVLGSVGLGFPGDDEEEEKEAAADAVASGLELIGGVGLGFCRAEEEEEEEEGGEEEGEELLGLASFSTPDATKGKKNEGFLSIGGIRVYTEDTSSPEEDIDLSEEDESDDDGEEDRDMLERDKMIGSGEQSSHEDGEDGEEDEEDEDSSSEGDSLSWGDVSDVDDEVARDYMEGIGADAKFLSTNWLDAMNLDSSDEDGFMKSGINAAKGVKELGGLDLMNASATYGMKKPKSKKSKGHARHDTTYLPAANVGVLAMDDLFFLKDSRATLRKKKPSSHLSRSWPHEAASRKNPGGKKKHHKELIALKRRQRMINRGVDLDKINYKLRQMVVNEVDMLQFQPMHTRDCSQVQRLASIYHLRSGYQGAGKKRFVTVSRTEKTCLPSTRDKIRLDKLLGASLDDAEDFVINHGVIKPLKQTKVKGSASRQHQSAPSKLAKNGEASVSRKLSGKQRLASFAERPVSFISSGVMQADPDKETRAENLNASTSREMFTNSSVGAFEMHTKGFGSRMMAKMGFVEGSGLGKEGQGMVQPIEVIKRPKSLGLGVQFEGESSIERAELGRIGAFEKHTKGFGSKMMAEMGRIGAFEKHTRGFGSKMMAKMGFIPGTGLGRDGQGIINPLTAVKRPKSRGLGAKTT